MRSSTLEMRALLCRFESRDLNLSTTRRSKRPKSDHINGQISECGHLCVEIADRQADEVERPGHAHNPCGGDGCGMIEM